MRNHMLLLIEADQRNVAINALNHAGLSCFKSLFTAAWLTAMLALMPEECKRPVRTEPLAIVECLCCKWSGESVRGGIEHQRASGHMVSFEGIEARDGFAGANVEVR